MTDVDSSLQKFFRDFRRSLNQSKGISIKDRHNNFIEEYKELYVESGIELLFDNYQRRLLIATYAMFAVSLGISFMIHDYFFDFTFSRSLFASLLISLVVSIISLIVGFLVPMYRGQQARTELEKNLVYSLSYMTMLSASGMPLERIFRRVSEVEDNPPLTHLAEKFLINVNLMGQDILTALKEMGQMSPSKNLTKQLESIRTTIMSSGDLKSIFIYEVERQLQKKRDDMKKSINTLVYLGEIYITLMVITPLLFILMITILSLMGGSSFGGSSVLQLNLIIFFGIPVLATAFIIVLDQVLVIEE